MVLKSFNGVCCTLVHAVAFAAAAWSIYLFLCTSFENAIALRKSLFAITHLEKFWRDDQVAIGGSHTGVGDRF